MGLQIDRYFKTQDYLGFHVFKNMYTDVLKKRTMNNLWIILYVSFTSTFTISC